MTTIAFDGEYLAADGMTSAGCVVVQLNKKKIHKLEITPNWLEDIGEKALYFAGAGALSAIQKMLESVYDHDDKGSELEGVYCCILTDKRVWMNEGGGWFPWGGEPFAIGSGSDFALSALRLGLSAKEAVKHACQHTLGSGGKIMNVKVWGD